MLDVSYGNFEIEHLTFKGRGPGIWDIREGEALAFRILERARPWNLQWHLRGRGPEIWMAFERARP